MLTSKRALLIAAAATLWLVVSWPGPACATPGSGALGGTAVDSSGTPVAGVTIYLYDSDEPGEFASLASAETSADGSYTFVGLTPGTYKLRCWDRTHSVVDGWYGDTGSGPTIFTVEADAALVADLTFVRGGSLSGLLHAQDGSSPGHFMVDLVPQAGTYWPEGSYRPWVVTADDGSWGWQGIPPGSYKVRFSAFGGSTQLDGYHPGVLAEASATVVDLPAASERSIETTLITGGVIWGHTTNGLSGEAVVAEHFVYRLDPDTHEWNKYPGAGSSGADGYYQIGRLPSGTYRVKASWLGWRTGYSVDSTTLADAQNVEVTQGQASQADMKLYPLERISGSARSAIAGRRLGPILFSLWTRGSDGWSLVETRTPSTWGESSASFSFEGIQPGIYRVTAKDALGEYLDLGYPAGQGVEGASDVLVHRGERVDLSLTLSPAHVWAEVPSGTDKSLHGVDFPDASHGWAVGASGTVLNTLDFGRTWHAQDSGVSEALRAVDFVDEQHGWAVGDSGVIVHTVDGGITWVSQTAGTGKHWSAVSFADAAHGWIIGGRAVYVTADGGDTWRHQADLAAGAITCSDAEHAWASGDSGVIYSTDDGGTTWVTHDSGSDRMQYSISSAGRSRVWSVGGLDNVLMSQDGGMSWTQQRVPPDCVYPWSVSSPDEEHAFVVGYHQAGGPSSRAVYATEDGGVSWVEQTMPDGGALACVSSPDATHAWAVGNGGAILVWSTDDLVAPVTTSVLDPAPNVAGWQRSNTIVRFSATDNYGGSGVAATEGTFDGLGLFTGDGLPVVTEGIHQVCFRSIDTSGNLEGTRTVTVRLDKTAPLTSDDHTAEYRDVATIRLRASDGLSGVAMTDYRLDGVFGQGASVQTRAHGIHVLEYASTDHAGNREATRTIAFRVRRSVKTSVTLSAKSSTKARRTFRITGAVTPSAASGKVVVLLERRIGGRWKRAVTISTRLSNGKFATAYWPKARGSWRMTASFGGRVSGDSDYLPSKTVRTFRVR
jgi:photosystem II stability/assembly factor-like uncharacterized protein